MLLENWKGYKMTIIAWHKNNMFPRILNTDDWNEALKISLQFESKYHNKLEKLELR